MRTRYFYNQNTNEITRDYNEAFDWWLHGSTVEYRITGGILYEVWHPVR